MANNDNRLILRNARVWTGEATSGKPGGQTYAEAVGVIDGLIAAVGGLAEVRHAVGAGAEEIDLGGRLVLPGFIDAHCHLIYGGKYLSGLDLSAANSIDDFVRMVKDAAEKTQPGHWLRGGGWNNETWPGQPLPHRDLIAPFTHDIPVMLSRADGHMALANTRALELAGVNEATPSPDGGRIDRDDSGRATGLLREKAMGLVREHIPEPTESDRREFVRAALRHAAKRGFTGMHDMGDIGLMPPLAELYKAGELTCRVSHWAGIQRLDRIDEIDPANILGDEYETSGSDDWLRLVGVKAYADGSLGSRTALTFEPYIDDPANRGLAMPGFLDGEMERLIGRADEMGYPAAVHCIGDRATSLTLDIFERIAKEREARDRRSSVEHAQHLRPEDVPRFARLGVVASIQPAHILLDIAPAERSLGPAQSARMYPLKTLLESGARVVFGTDWPVVPLDPFEGIYAAVTRCPLDDSFPGGWVPEQRISVADAVRCFTSRAAYAEFMEGKKGAIRPGMFADLIVLSDNIFDIAPARILDTRIDMTVVGGRVVYSSANI